jgi:hypothetical protein
VSSGRPLRTLAEFFADALPAIRGSSTASSSMRPGPRPTWSAHMVGDREDSACANKRRTGIGKRSHFLRPCDTTRIDAPCVLDGPINGESFKTYIAQFLVPTLKPGDMVIMDNLGSHKGYAVRRAIRRREASVPAALLFLTSILSSRCSPS